MKQSINQVEIQFPENREELIRKAVECEARCVSVGGLARRLGILQAHKPEISGVFGLLIEFARRERGLSVEELANKADVGLAELLAIERNEEVTPTPRTVFQLAKILKLSTAKLMEIAGLAEAKDKTLNQAALRFAARSESMAALSKVEREAFEEFVKVLVDHSGESGAVA